MRSTQLRSVRRLSQLLMVAVSAVIIAACRPAAVAPCGTALDAVPICGTSNPEDMARFDGTNLILFPQGRGGVIDAPLVVLDAMTKAIAAPSIEYPTDVAFQSQGDPACMTAPALPRYRGIDVRRGDDGVYRVAAINGATKQRIELFTARVDGNTVALAWQGCVSVPDLWFLNDVALGPDWKLFATHMFYRQSGLRQIYLTAKLFAGVRTGYAVNWQPDRGWTRVPNSAGSFPNGIATNAFGTHIYMASTYESLISRIDVNTGERQDMLLPVRPDNITWSEDGGLVVAGGNGVRMLSTRGCDAFAAPGCAFPFGVVQTDSLLTRRQTIFSSEDMKIPGASVALQIGNSLFLGSAFADRITIVTP